MKPDRSRARRNGSTTTRATSARAATKKRVFGFGAGQAEGDRTMRELLGGKGANLAEMANLGLPVPAGFTITTEVCGEVRRRDGRFPQGFEAEVRAALRAVERLQGRRFGDRDDPLLVSVRSGARVSMPGMMDTVLNLGLSRATLPGLARRTGNPRFAWDAYRRFVQMYGDVVLGVRAREDEHEAPLHAPLARLKRRRGVREDTALDAADLEELAGELERVVQERSGAPFPADPWEQLWGAIRAVFRSWENERAIAYRRMHSIPDDWGTAVSVVAMVFGNLGETSGTGVAFTRDPASGEKRFWGEYLANAQGEDVVAGLRTPLPLEALERSQPAAWKELLRIQKKLERHYRDMQDLEFTIEDGRLFMLQCRSGKRTGFAALRIAVDMVAERLIGKREALLRVEPSALDQVLQPVFAAAELESARREGRVVAKGLPAGPGAASGRIALRAAHAEARASRGEAVILVRHETSPEDIKGMRASVGILTAQGGMTSHAALVARQMGKVCVVGAEGVEVEPATGKVRIGERVFAEGDWLSLDGTTGEVLAGALSTAPSEVAAYLLGKPRRGAKESALVAAYRTLMAWADEVRALRVRANADQPEQCETAVRLGAEGVGLCRTEHMFFGEGKIERVQRMILADSLEEREDALAELLPLQREDFRGIFRAMAGLPVTIRTLDPPLHEFLPHGEEDLLDLARRLAKPAEHVARQVASLREQNPMLGHRGCRLGILHPEITRMQARAIFEAACDVARAGEPPSVEVMIPLVGSARELELQAAEVRGIAEQVFATRGERVPYLVGTMIELPRAALTAGAIAGVAEFFSFGTNDLTQTTLGISRDDGGKFIPRYLELGVWEDDPFATLDRGGVGRLMRLAVEEGRAARPRLKLGICGEHGGDPRSIELCQELRLDYVSCSPFRVPIARLAAARAALSG